MNIAKYTGYFHDGGLIGVKRKKNNMELFLRSCEISSNEPIDRTILSEDSALKGKLCLEGVKWIKVAGKENVEIPWKNYDDGEILDLEIDNNKVFLLIEWKNWPPKPRLRTNDVSTIEIEAEKVYWENIPDLSDDYFKMDVAKYVDYFHDGYVNNVSHIGNNISFSLESSVVENLDEVADKHLLSDSNTFKGTLNVLNIKNFKLWDKKYDGIFQAQYVDGDILDLEIKDNKIFLLVEWKNFPPKVRKTDISKIEIEAEKIQWIPG